MYNITSDLHTHTLVSDHAYTTLLENAAAAKQRRLYGIAETDHGAESSDGPHSWHHGSLMTTIPPFIKGVRFFRGVEANIMDYNGKLDTPGFLLRRFEWVIASCHGPCLQNPNPDAVTEAWLKIAVNPLVDSIGHCDEDAYRFDYERVIPEFAREGKIVELNNHSFAVRAGASVNCPVIAKLCKKHGVRIAVTSDAHYAGDIAYFTQVLEMLEEIEYPHELIINHGDPQKIEDHIADKFKRLAQLAAAMKNNMR